MNLTLSDEQEMLKESINRLMLQKYTFADRNRYQVNEHGYDKSIWSTYADLGLLALPFHEEYGGFGGTAIDTMVVMEALGAALTLEPYLSTVVLAGGVLRHGGTAEQKERFLPNLVAGQSTWSLAYLEPKSRYDLHNVETAAKKVGSNWIISGRKCLVLHGDSADRIIVAARTSGDHLGQQGIGLFVVDGDAVGVERQGYRTQSGSRAADIILNDVLVHESFLIGDAEGGFPILSRVIDEAVAAVCAEAVGAFDQMVKITLEYLKTREQFGKHIGSFQALQHKAVDMLVELEQSRSMALFSALMVASEDVCERERATSAAKIQIGRSARVIGHTAIQLHGGIGMTMDCKIGHYFKHVTMINALFGNSDYHLERLAALGGLVSASE